MRIDPATNTNQTRNLAALETDLNFTTHKITHKNNHKISVLAPSEYIKNERIYLSAGFTKIAHAFVFSRPTPATPSSQVSLKGRLDSCSWFKTLLLESSPRPGEWITSLHISDLYAVCQRQKRSFKYIYLFIKHWMVWCSEPSRPLKSIKMSVYCPQSQKPTWTSSIQFLCVFICISNKRPPSLLLLS